MFESSNKEGELVSSQSDLNHKSSSCVSVVRLSVILISSQDSVQGHNSAVCLNSHDSRVPSLSKLNQIMSKLSIIINHRDCEPPEFICQSILR